MDSIRRQDYDLRLEDLMKFPVWEYALDEEGIDGQNERTLRPLPSVTIIDPRAGYFITRASFYFHSGIVMIGFIKPKSLSSKTLSTVLPYDLWPVIVTMKGQMSFGYGSNEPDVDELERNYRFFEMTPEEIFPIRFISDIEVIDGISSGVIEGFMFFDEDTKDFFHLTGEDIRIIR